MSPPDPAAEPPLPASSGDPWHAFGYLVSGVGVSGLVGWLLDRWLDTSFLLPLGIVLGAVLGLYLTFVRFIRQH